jgi:hypothetical protein
LVDNPQPKPEAPRHIGFETFVDKATRAAGTNSNNLQDFYPSFNVYGWKTVGNVTSPVFENVVVSYCNGVDKKPSTEWGDNTPAGWYYENIRYWDKMASKYQYSAFTPTPSGVSFKCTSDGLIEIGTAESPVTVDSKNLMSTPSTLLAYTGFEKDYMTAQAKAEPSTDAADMSTPVSLNFSHLQAKLNIRIMLHESMTTAQDIIVQKIKVHNLGDKAYYTNDATVTGTVSGWKLYTASNNQEEDDSENTPETVEETIEYVPSIESTDNLSYQLNGTTAGTDNFNNYYVLEQLIIPQTITKFVPQTPETTEETGDNTGTEDGNDEGTDNEGGEGSEDNTEEPTPSAVPLPVSLSEYEVACVYVEYTIGTEVFKSFTPLSNIFSNEATYNFEGGNQYTLNITIGPKPIEFTAVVSEWIEGNTSNLPMD